MTRRLLAIMLMAACADPTETIVLIDLAESLRARGSDLRVQVVNQDGETVLDQEVPLSDLEFPARVPLTPADGDASRTWQLTASVHTDYGCLLASGSLEGGYDEDVHSEVPLDILPVEGACPEVFIDRDSGSNDPEACTDALTPCSSIGYAIDNYLASGAVRVLTLVNAYFGDVSTIELQGTADNPFVIRGRADEPRPVWDLQGEGFTIGDAQYVELRHIHFQNGSQISMNYGGGHAVRDCVFEGFTDAALNLGFGVNVGSAELFVYIEDNRFVGNGTGFNVEWDIPRVEVRDNIFVGNRWGIRSGGNTTLVSRNQICDNTSGGIFHRNSCLIEHNTVVRNGLGVEIERIECQLTDNILAFNEAPQFKVSSERSTHTRRNIYWPAENAIENTEADASDRLVDPLLVGESCGELQVEPTSEAIGNGLDGSTIGAWEFVGEP